MGRVHWYSLATLGIPELTEASCKENIVACFLKLQKYSQYLVLNMERKRAVNTQIFL